MATQEDNKPVTTADADPAAPFLKQAHAAVEVLRQEAEEVKARTVREEAVATEIREKTRTQDELDRIVAYLHSLYQIEEQRKAITPILERHGVNAGQSRDETCAQFEAARDVLTQNVAEARKQEDIANGMSGAAYGKENDAAHPKQLAVNNRRDHTIAAIYIFDNAAALHLASMNARIAAFNHETAVLKALADMTVIVDDETRKSALKTTIENAAGRIQQRQSGAETLRDAYKGLHDHQISALGEAARQEHRVRRGKKWRYTQTRTEIDLWEQLTTAAKIQRDMAKITGGAEVAEKRLERVTARYGKLTRRGAPAPQKQAFLGLE